MEDDAVALAFRGDSDAVASTLPNGDSTLAPCPPSPALLLLLLMLMPLELGVVAWKLGMEAEVPPDEKG